MMNFVMSETYWSAFEHIQEVIAENDEGLLSPVEISRRLGLALADLEAAEDLAKEKTRKG